MIPNFWTILAFWTSSGDLCLGDWGIFYQILKPHMLKKISEKVPRLSHKAQLMGFQRLPNIQIRDISSFL